MKHFKPTEQRAEIMEAMSEIAGVTWAETVALDPKMEMAFHAAQRSCAQCEREDDCLAWMATNPAAGQAADFCRNQALLHVLRRLREQGDNETADQAGE
ncbi:DUF6455 family protein [Candidatus Halocynthiibacter alkanivorans]|uniref:DUF6455 family protein n=1 Tax=Candidatus Halocynthiibacter alkanivorans TaxID=2267619 RepID=UPI000DF34196|nr:DUF6455 family protein [Candidatus Halocynthiibacter alkanivorans]